MLFRILSVTLVLANINLIVLLIQEVKFLNDFFIHLRNLYVKVLLNSVPALILLMIVDIKIAKHI